MAPFIEAGFTLEQNTAQSIDVPPLQESQDIGNNSSVSYSSQDIGAQVLQSTRLNRIKQIVPEVKNMVLATYKKFVQKDIKSSPQKNGIESPESTSSQAKVTTSETIDQILDYVPADNGRPPKIPYDSYFASYWDDKEGIKEYRPANRLEAELGHDPFVTAENAKRRENERWLSLLGSFPKHDMSQENKKILNDSDIEK